MADSSMQVELVAADRLVWSGEATMVIARTTEGELGVLARHTPLLSVLVPGVVKITTGNEDRLAAVDGGFISVAGNRISLLAEHAELADDIDVSQARSDLEQAGPEDSDDSDDAARAWAEARIQAAEAS
jgi:F-type H+-transporting ATPase subunit epsilon